MVQRLLDGERGLTTGTLDKLGRIFGLKIIETGRSVVPDGRPRSQHPWKKPAIRTSND